MVAGIIYAQQRSAWDYPIMAQDEIALERFRDENGMRYRINENQETVILSTTVNYINK
jgi:hypothetical protein